MSTRPTWDVFLWPVRSRSDRFSRDTDLWLNRSFLLPWRRGLNVLLWRQTVRFKNTHYKTDPFDSKRLHGVSRCTFECCGSGRTDTGTCSLDNIVGIVIFHIYKKVSVRGRCLEGLEGVSFLTRSQWRYRGRVVPHNMTTCLLTIFPTHFLTYVCVGDEERDAWGPGRETTY